MLIFSEYDNSLINVFSSQPVVDIQLEDTNCFLVRFPRFKQVTHLILAYDAENLFLKSKSAYGSFFNFEKMLSDLEEKNDVGYFVIGVTSNISRKKQYNPYPRLQRENFATAHINNIMTMYLPRILSDYDVDFDSLIKIVMGASMGGLMSLKTSIMYPLFNNVVSLSPAFWFGYPGIVDDLSNLSHFSVCNISVGTKEGNVFGDKVKNIFPNTWDLDFSSNDQFYISGVEKIKDKLLERKITTNYVSQDGGEHNENYWNPILKDFLVSI